MSRPSVFVCSAYYDLRPVQYSLENFIEALGYDCIFSKKQDVLNLSEAPFDAYWSQESGQTDIFVLIIGGGATSDNKQLGSEFFENYDNITKQEYEFACARNIPVYILIKDTVYAEYQTYLRNKTNDNICYAHVEMANIFPLIEEILLKPHNSSVHTFERFSDMANWLRDRWANLFGELLQDMSRQQQIVTLSRQVETLGAINATLHKFVETLVAKVSPENTSELIEYEQQRLDEIEQTNVLKKNSAFKVLAERNVDICQYREALLDADTFGDFKEKLDQLTHEAEKIKSFLSVYSCSSQAKRSLNEARVVLGKRPFFPLLDKGQ